MRPRRIKKGIIPLIAIIIGIIIYIMFTTKEPNKEGPEVKTPKVINEIKEYGYKLDDSKSKYYKDLFIELKEELSNEEINEENYAKLISRLFIIDFYTLKDKVTKNDVGGTMFIFTDYRNDFISKAKDTVYKYIENNIYGDRTQKLPVVVNTEVLSIKQKSFTYLNDKKDSKAYEVTIVWSYEENLGYETDASIILVHEGNKLSIVEMN